MIWDDNISFEGFDKKVDDWFWKKSKQDQNLK